MSPGRRRVLVPLLLAAGVGLAGCGGDDDSSAADTTTGASAPAETPGATAAPSPTPTAPPTGTPPPTPGTAPAPSPTPGTAIPGEALTAEQAAELQEEVDEGHQPWRTDVAAVADSFVAAQLGWDDASVALADPHTAEVTHPADGRMVTLQLRQPAREGDGGIWVVIGGFWLT